MITMGGGAAEKHEFNQGMFKPGFAWLACLSAAVALAMLATKSTRSSTDSAAGAVVEIRLLRNGKIGGYGHGVVVSKKHVLTSWHVVQLAEDIQVASTMGEVSSIAGVTAYDVGRDLVALELAEPWRGTILPVVSVRPGIGAKTRTVVQSSRRGQTWSLASEVLDARTWPDGFVTLELGHASQSGYSGAPVLNERGQVIALMTMRHPYGTCFVAPVSDFGFDKPAKPIKQVVERADPAIVSNKWYALGDEQMDADEFQQAVESFENALIYNNVHWQAMYDLAYCLNRSGRERDGLRWRKRLHQLIPDEPMFLERYALDLTDTNRREEAIALAKRAEELCPPRGVECLETIRAIYDHYGLQADAERVHSKQRAWAASKPAPWPLRKRQRAFGDFTQELQALRAQEQETSHD